MMARNYPDYVNKQSVMFLYVKTLINLKLDVVAFRDSLLKLAKIYPSFSFSKILIDQVEFYRMRYHFSE